MIKRKDSEALMTSEFCFTKLRNRRFPPHRHISQRCREDDGDRARDAEDQVRHDANPLDEADETTAQEDLTARVPVAVAVFLSQEFDLRLGA